jgi:hypothetical protein
MKLGAYIINGTPASQLDTINDSDLNGNAPFIVANTTLPANYQDISSIENWDKYGLRLVGSATYYQDWKCLQREIRALANTAVNNDYNLNWNNLNAGEKSVVCRYLTSKVPIARFAETFPNASDRLSISIQFDMQNRQARGNWISGVGRLQIMRIYLFGKIGTANALATFSDAVKDGLIELYEGGIEGSVEDGFVGINDFLLARAGTIYETTGLKARSYPVIDGSSDTLETVSNTLVQIGSNGMY